MKLSIYLFREDTRSFEGLIRKGASAAPRELVPSTALPYECRAFVQVNRGHAPKWATFLASHFDTERLGLQNASSSFVLLLKVKERFFAATFGHGFQALERSRIEPRFGLLSSLSQLDPKQIRTMDTRNVDQIVRQRRTHVSIGSPITEFGLDMHAELLRYVSGRPQDQTFAKSLGGSDSLSITCEVSLRELGEKCAALLELYQSEKYKDHFPFADRLQPLKSGDAAIAPLEQVLADRLAKRSDEHLIAAFPDFYDETHVEKFRLSYRRKSIDAPNISLSEVFRLFETCPDAVQAVRGVRVIGLDVDENAATDERSLYECLVAEAPSEGDTFVLTFGQWHRASRSFVQQVRNEVAALADLTDRLQMPAMKSKENEGDYNERVAKEKDWLLMDKKLIRVDRRDGIEVCDLASPNGEFIAVKKMRDSATLSHLFAQASVSAHLLRAEGKYRQAVLDQLKSKWQDFRLDDDERKLCFVYALPTKKQGRIGEEMFLFSQINLLRHIEVITNLGFDVALCKIKYGVQQ